MACLSRLSWRARRGLRKGMVRRDGELQQKWRVAIGVLVQGWGWCGPGFRGRGFVPSLTVTVQLSDLSTGVVQSTVLVLEELVNIQLHRHHDPDSREDCWSAVKCENP